MSEALRLSSYAKLLGYAANLPHWGMSMVLPGLYVGNYRDSKDQQQLDKHQITHILAIHDSPKRLLPDKHYLCVMAADTPDQNLSQYFSDCNDFIHAARLRQGNVLIHCLAGMSRSVTVAVAYIMTATNLNWKEALKVVRAGRAVANPNAGFQTQLQEFEMYRLSEERRRLRERYPSTMLEPQDREKCLVALDNYREMLQNKDICEGNCSRGETCPTGGSQHEGSVVTQTAVGGVDCGTPTQGSQCPASSSAAVQAGSSSTSTAYVLSFAVEQWSARRTATMNKSKSESSISDKGLLDESSPGRQIRENVIYFPPVKIGPGGLEEYGDMYQEEIKVSENEQCGMENEDKDKKSEK